MKEIFNRGLHDHRQAIEQLDCLEAPLTELSGVIFSSLKKGGKFLLFGNGGSAADAQHIAAEITGRFVLERPGLAAIALTTDTSALTAIANDYGYEQVFARQVQALARSGDVLLGISTSGNSANVLRALEEGQRIGCSCFGFSGRDGGFMNSLLGQRNLVVRNSETARVQECHILLGHLLCAMIDSRWEMEKSK